SMKMQFSRGLSKINLFVHSSSTFIQPFRAFTRHGKNPFNRLSWDSIQPDKTEKTSSIDDSVDAVIKVAELAAKQADEAATTAATEALLAASQRHLSLLPEDARFLRSGLSPLALLPDDQAESPVDSAAAGRARQAVPAGCPHWGRVSEPAARPEQTGGRSQQQQLNPTYADCAKRDWARVFLRPPTNPWQELIQLTAEGKLWHYPIDNEQGRELEPDGRVSFQRHVMLERQLQDWVPKTGPVRHFMETVCVGLSKNPYLTAAEKADHLDWYRRYFADKIDRIQAVYEQSAEPTEA
ncbi:hypothetical protein BOX15_Mlig013380g3, partial [Macrostomum lignano]